MKGKVVTIFQWILAVLGLLIAISCFSSGGAGIIGGIIVLLSAIWVSPIIGKTPILAKSDKARLALQFVGAFVLLVIGVGISPKNTTETNEDSVSSEISVTTPTEAETTTETATTDETTATEEISEKVIEAETEALTEDTTSRSGEEIVGVSDKSLSDDGINIDFENSVRNDSTGKWRLARIADNINIEEYALDYYKNYFESDDEIHAVVNFTNNTTTNLSCFGDMLFVTTYNYVDKEEHDADLLFTGEKISEFCVYIDNGDIEKVS